MTLLGVPPGVVGVDGTVGVSVAGGECAGRSCVVRLRIGGGLGRGAAARLRGRLVLRWRTVEAGFLVVDERRRVVSVGIAAGAWSVETVGGGWERCAGRGRTAGVGALVIGRRNEPRDGVSDTPQGAPRARERDRSRGRRRAPRASQPRGARPRQVLAGMRQPHQPVSAPGGDGARLAHEVTRKAGEIAGRRPRPASRRRPNRTRLADGRRCGQVAVVDHDAVLGRTVLLALAPREAVEALVNL